MCGGGRSGCESGWVVVDKKERKNNNTLRIYLNNKISRLEKKKKEKNVPLIPQNCFFSYLKTTTKYQMQKIPVHKTFLICYFFHISFSPPFSFFPPFLISPFIFLLSVSYFSFTYRFLLYSCLFYCLFFLFLSCSSLPSPLYMF